VIQRHHVYKGVLLLDSLIGIGVFLLFTVGIYSGIQYTFTSVYVSRVRILETSILNEQMELVRNLAFDDVGIVQGAPAGVLHRTVTTTRNGIDFVITRTVRSIDDGFDGVIGGGSDGKVTVCHNGNTLRVGAPAQQAHLNHGDVSGPCPGDSEPTLQNDLSPADYKMVQFDIVCASCEQRRPLSATTYVGPKFLEGDPTHGALKVVVIDSEGQPVVDADVRIVATSTDPTYDFTDTTNNSGELLIPDLDAGQNAYSITVSKSGYTTDQTRTSISNPVKPPASVVAQDIQTITFEIDEAATMDITAYTAVCAPVSGASVHTMGTNVIGTSPDTLLVDTVNNTSGSGGISLSSLRWDDYVFDASGYNIVGAIPMMAVRLLPGEEKPVTLILGTASTHSLLMHVQDNVSLQPISSATVTLTAPGYSQEKETGVGHVRQSDWSLGAGSETFNEGYFVQSDGNVIFASSPGNLTLRHNGISYVSSGVLESATFDAGVMANFVSLVWEPLAQPAQTNAQFQVAVSNSSTPQTWDYRGPDGTAGTYYDIQNSALTGVSGQYIRYKVFLSSADGNSTPTLSDVAMSYTTSCTPPGQSYFGSLSSQTYTATITADGYAPLSAEIGVSGETRFIANMTSL
jgi:hypothetical protein